MPIVLCRFCEYIGQVFIAGDYADQREDVLDMWHDAQEHEISEHSVELAELDDLEANPE